ncbi:putative transposase [Oscillibacter valericigenes Sjm18-20]|nr:putative transposase [Oscillibacter valericigenes Sjm18-20]
MNLAGVSIRRGKDITEPLWGTRVSPATISRLNKKTYVHIVRNRPLQGGKYPLSVYVDGLYFRRRGCHEFKYKLRSWAY